MKELWLNQFMFFTKVFFNYCAWEKTTYKNVKICKVCKLGEDCLFKSLKVPYIPSRVGKIARHALWFLKYYSLLCDKYDLVVIVGSFCSFLHDLSSSFIDVDIFVICKDNMYDHEYLKKAIADDLGYSPRVYIQNCSFLPFVSYKFCISRHLPMLNVIVKRRYSPLAISSEGFHTQKVINLLEESYFDTIKIALKDLELVNISEDGKSSAWVLSGKVLRFGKGLKAEHSIPDLEKDELKCIVRLNLGVTISNPRTLLVEAWDKCFQMYKKL
jgi:hypothetical protein